MATRTLLPLVLTAVCVNLLNFSGTAHGQKIPTIPKWQRFELTLKSRVAYTNALQEAELRALFVSPLGETNRVYGFWDGGKTWRVRYQPSFPGRWTYYTMCSDPGNKGLHGQSGEFLCTATKGDSPFDLHGPVAVARDQQHLEHADRTPFLWLGDAAWLAASKSTLTDWKEYSATRAAQKFNVVEWRLHPAEHGAKQTAFTGRDCLVVNLEFFRALDAKIVAANQAGLLNAIAPLWEIGDNTEAFLPEAQAILLMRYALARWGAEDVAWIVAFESDSTGAQATRWQTIGRAVFNLVSHGPVVLLPGESVWVFDAFRRERWVDVLGIQTALVTDDNSLPWFLNGPLALERQKTPAHPLITIAPPAEVPATPNSSQVTADFARRMLWWSLLLNTPAGVSYRAQEVADWNTAPQTSASQPWRQALSLAGAGAIAPLAGCLAGKEFWELEPAPQTLINQPGFSAPQHHIAAARNETQPLIICYTPEERTLNLATPIPVPPSKASWFDPRTGTSQAATSTSLKPGEQRFTTPAKGDWLLILPQPPVRSWVVETKKPDGKIDKQKRD